MTDAPLSRVLDALEHLGIEYMLTGSYASNIYGKVRSTFDADFVVALSAPQTSKLAEALGEGFYVDILSRAEILESGGQFNAIHAASGLKIDFYLVRDDEYSRQAFARKRQEKLWGRPAWIISPEDLVLAKLQWAKAGGSQRQIEDAAGIYQMQKNRLDILYIRNWAKKLSITDLADQAFK